VCTIHMLLHNKIPIISSSKGEIVALSKFIQLFELCADSYASLSSLPGRCNFKLMQSMFVE